MLKNRLMILGILLIASAFPVVHADSYYLPVRDHGLHHDQDKLREAIQKRDFDMQKLNFFRNQGDYRGVEYMKRQVHMDNERIVQIKGEIHEKYEMHERHGF